jgi:hypothetical protein
MLMKRTILAPALLLAVFVSLVPGIPAVKIANTNFFPGDALIISSPISKMVYSNTSIPLKIVASVANPTPEVVSITYCLDENYNVTLTDLSKTLREPSYIDGSQFSAELVLKNLAEGNHIIEAYSRDAIGRQMSASAEFVVDTSYTIPLTIVSPQNTTYYSTEVPLTFICREDGKYDGKFYEGSYMLDGIGSDIIHDNLTLTGLSVGSHTIMVGVSTETWFFSETLQFSIFEGQEPKSSPRHSPEPNPTPTQAPQNEPQLGQEVFLGVAITVAVLGAGLGLLIYLFRRK